MKVGDLVKVLFPYDQHSIGIVVEYEESGRNVVTKAPRRSRAKVFWDGEIISTPIDQIEVLNESR